MEKTNWSSKEVRNRYMRQWRKRNQNKVKQYQETYWAKKAKEMEVEGCQSLMQQ